MQPVKLTNVREALAYLLTQLIRIAALYLLGATVLPAVYNQLYLTGHIVLVSAVSYGLGALMMLAALPVFLLFRALFGGVSPLVAAAGRKRAFVSSGAEIGAYILTGVIVLVLGGFVFFLVSLYVYAPLRAGGNARLILSVALTVSTALALINFLIFIGLRRGFAGPRIAETAAGDAASGPYVGSRMGFGGAISSCFRNYAVFSGRAPRPEYWYWALFQALLLIPLAIVDGVAFGPGAGPLSGLAALALFLPTLAVTARRLHDIDKSGWWILISLFPIIGGIALLVMVCLRGTAGPNRFGAPPA